MGIAIEEISRINNMSNVKKDTKNQQSRKNQRKKNLCISCVYLSNCTLTKNFNERSCKRYKERDLKDSSFNELLDEELKKQ